MYSWLSYTIFIPVDGGWSEDMFPSCPRNNGSCGEVTVSHIKECNNPTPSLGGRNCLCSGFSSVVVTNCTGLTAIVTKECSPRSCKL